MKREIHWTVILIPVLFALSTFMLLRWQCTPIEAQLSKVGLRVATYNVQWLSEDIHPQRAAHLRSVIRNLDADIVAFQEVENKSALENLLGKGWEIAIEDAPSERQELAIAVRKPLKIEHYEMVFDDSTFDSAFPGKRDVLRAIISNGHGVSIIVYSVHLKSRSGGRKQTDWQREWACALLASYLKKDSKALTVVLGDFNDTPDDAGPNILETGNLFAKGEMENESDIYFCNLTEPLFAKDGVSYGLYRRFRGVALSPRVPGARKENEKWRGKDYGYPDDLAVREILFDQILVSQKLKKLQIGEAQIYNKPDALRGSMSNERNLEKNGATGTLASDHLPVFADFRIPVIFPPVDKGGSLREVFSPH